MSRPLTLSDHVDKVNRIAARLAGDDAQKFLGGDFHTWSWVNAQARKLWHQACEIYKEITHYDVAAAITAHSAEQQGEWRRFNQDKKHRHSTQHLQHPHILAPLKEHFAHCLNAIPDAQAHLHLNRFGVPVATKIKEPLCTLLIELGGSEEETGWISQLAKHLAETSLKGEREDQLKHAIYWTLAYLSSLCSPNIEE